MLRAIGIKGGGIIAYLIERFITLRRAMNRQHISHFTSIEWWNKATLVKLLIALILNILNVTGFDRGLLNRALLSLVRRALQ